MLMSLPPLFLFPIITLVSVAIFRDERWYTHTIVPSFINISPFSRHIFFQRKNKGACAFIRGPVSARERVRSAEMNRMPPNNSLLALSVSSGCDFFEVADLTIMHRRSNRFRWCIFNHFLFGLITDKYVRNGIMSMVISVLEYA